MDFAAALPAPAAAGNRVCPSRGAGDGDTRDSRVEETGALSFPGLLEQSRDSEPGNESRSPGGCEPADRATDPVRSGDVATREASPGPEGKPVPTEISQGNVLPGIGRMIKVQMAVEGLETNVAPAAAGLALGRSGQAAELAGMDQPALPDYQPTGGDGLATPAIALPESGGEAGQEAAAGTGTPRQEALSAEPEKPGQGGEGDGGSPWTRAGRRQA